MVDGGTGRRWRSRRLRRALRTGALCVPSSIEARQHRQRAEIDTLIDARRLDRAADLAHVHLAEFPEARLARFAIVGALHASDDCRLRRRAGEFTPA